MVEVKNAIGNMKAAGFPEKDIIALLGISERDYHHLLADISRRSAHGSGASELPETPRPSNVSVPSSHHDTPRRLHGASGESPENDGSALVERAESAPEDFQPRGDDLLLSELQRELLMVYYRNCNNVNKSLEQIKNDKGQGLSGRYFRHASYILEQHGLKKKKV